MFGSKKRWPIPAQLPARCPACNAPLAFEAVVLVDAALGSEKVDHYHAACNCGQAHDYDGRGQRVEPAIVNLPPDLSPVAQTPNGLIAYAGAWEAPPAPTAPPVAAAKPEAAAPAPE